MKLRSTPPSAATARPTGRMPHRRPRCRYAVPAYLRRSLLPPLLSPGLQRTGYGKLQRRVNTVEEFLVRERLSKVADGSRFQRPNARAIVREGRDEDDRDRVVRCD